MTRTIPWRSVEAEVVRDRLRTARLPVPPDGQGHVVAHDALATGLGPGRRRTGEQNGDRQRGKPERPARHVHGGQGRHPSQRYLFRCSQRNANHPHTGGR